MRKSKNNESYGLTSKKEAFEFLVKESQEQELKEYWKGEFEKLPDPPLRFRYKLMYMIKRYGGVAAIFILVLGAFYWISIPENSIDKLATKMAYETNIVFMPELATRGIKSSDISATEQNLMIKISVAMEKESYSEAIQLFSTAGQINKLSTEQKFFYGLAISKSENSDYSKGIQLMDYVIQENGKYYEESLWIQSLLYLKVGEKENARTTLNKLINRSNYQFKNVKALLEKLGEKN